jgi:hypothetical protein
VVVTLRSAPMSRPSGTSGTTMIDTEFESRAVLTQQTPRSHGARNRDPPLHTDSRLPNAGTPSVALSSDTRIRRARLDRQRAAIPQTAGRPRAGELHERGTRPRSRLATFGPHVSQCPLAPAPSWSTTPSGPDWWGSTTFTSSLPGSDASRAWEQSRFTASRVGRPRGGFRPGTMRTRSQRSHSVR